MPANGVAIRHERQPVWPCIEFSVTGQDIGTEFDPIDVGFKSSPGDGPFEFRVRDANNKIIPGNDNAGHDYGTASMTEQERRALVEYLKTL